MTKLHGIVFLLLPFFVACKSPQVEQNTIDKSKHIMSDTSDFTKIYSQKINNNFVLEMTRKEEDSSCVWQINIVSEKENRTIKTDSIDREDNENINFHLARHPKFYDAFQVLDVKHDVSTNRLFVLIDKFGTINLHQYTFDGKSLNGLREGKMIKVGTYVVRPMDMDLIIAKSVELSATENDVLIGILVMKETFYRVNLNTQKTTSLIFDYYDAERVKIKDEESHEFISTGDLSRENKTKKIIENLLEKKNQINQSWVYHFFIESPSSIYSYEKDGKRNGLVYFFTTVNGNKKVLIYDTSAAKEWVITDYQELSEGESEDNTWK